jgi:hypothetical protein
MGHGPLIVETTSTADHPYGLFTFLRFGETPAHLAQRQHAQIDTLDLSKPSVDLFLFEGAVHISINVFCRKRAVGFPTSSQIACKEATVAHKSAIPFEEWGARNLQMRSDRPQDMRQ